MLQGIESFVLGHWRDYVLGRKVTHVSLAYDGMRIDKERFLAEENFCAGRPKFGVCVFVCTRVSFFWGCVFNGFVFFFQFQTIIFLITDSIMVFDI